MATPLSPTKKLLFAVFVVVAVPTLIELSLALFGVQPAAVAEDPYVGFQVSIPLFVKEHDEDGRLVYRTAPNKLGWFNEQSFPAVKSRKTYRIFCLGGSTTYGRPYDDRTSFVGWLRRFLRAADPRKDWQVINCGGVSYASYRVGALMEELIHHEPDLFIIYTGHNEFLEQRTYAGIVEEHPVVTRLNLVLHRSRMASLMRSAARRFFPDQREVAKERYRLAGEVEALLDTSVGLDQYHRDDVLRQQIVRHYKFNLGRMVVLARSAGADVIFIDPAANIEDFSPFKSQHGDSCSESELVAWEEFFERGLRAARNDDHETARIAFEEALEIDDRYAQLHYELGRSLFALGRLDAAQVAFERARSEDVCPLRILPEMSQVLTDVARQHDVALVDFVSRLEDRCRQEHGHTMLGNDYFLDHVHPTIAIHRLLGELLLDGLIKRRTVQPSAEWNEAAADVIAADLERTLDRRDHARARVVLARVLHWAGKVEESDYLLASAVEVIGDEAETIVLLARSLERQGKVREAIEQYERALRIKPGILEAYVALGRLLVKVGQVDDGIARYRAALRVSPDYVLARHNLGVALSKQGRLSEAIEQFQQALRINPTRPSTHASLAKTLMRQGNLDEALTHCEETLRLNPRSAKAHMVWGVVLVRLGKLGEAVEHYHKALRIDPKNGKVHYNLGTALIRQHDLDQAIEHFERAVRIRPGFIDAHFNLALALAQKREFDQAAQHLQRVLELAPDDRSAYYHLGMVYASSGSFSECIEVLRQGLEVVPDDVQIRGRLAWLLATCPQDDLRDGSKAIELAQHVCELSGYRNPEHLDTLAAAYAETGRFAEAVETARNAIPLASSAGDTALAAHIKERLELYSAGRPYRSPCP